MTFFTQIFNACFSSPNKLLQIKMIKSWILAFSSTNHLFLMQYKKILEHFFYAYHWGKCLRTMWSWPNPTIVLSKAYNKYSCIEICFINIIYKYIFINGVFLLCNCQAIAKTTAAHRPLYANSIWSLTMPKNLEDNICWSKSHDLAL